MCAVTRQSAVAVSARARELHMTAATRLVPGAAASSRAIAATTSCNVRIQLLATPITNNFHQDQITGK